MPRKIEIREGLFQCWEGVTNEVVSGKRQVCSFTVEPQSSQKEMISLIVSKKCYIQNTLNHSLFQLRLFLKLCVPYCVKCPEITDIVCGYNVYMHFIQLPKSWQTLKEICLFFSPNSCLCWTWFVIWLLELYCCHQQFEKCFHHLSYSNCCLESYRGFLTYGLWIKRKMRKHYSLCDPLQAL